MAITVVGGLVATTFLTLFVIPIIYSLFEKVKFKEKIA
jgi:HAE1 family hydrophobic/amphiphilic exporter-1